jgi:ELMO/CED-12 family
MQTRIEIIPGVSRNTRSKSSLAHAGTYAPQLVQGQPKKQSSYLTTMDWHSFIPIHSPFPLSIFAFFSQWWEEGIEETGKMIISYDNLIVRLWLNGAIMPHEKVSEEVDKASIDTLITDQGLPPVPHDYWVHRLGFQQPDPVTDFRSGGVLSLAMLVHIVEACPMVHERFVLPHGDASVLPFGITCINVTDMLSKFCMLAKSVDRMDALLSQKPFWRMFADPNSILALQEVSLDMLADVVVELREERRIPGYRAPDDNNTHNYQSSSLHNDNDDPGKVRTHVCV